MNTLKNIVTVGSIGLGLALAYASIAPAHAHRSAPATGTVTVGPIAVEAPFYELHEQTIAAFDVGPGRAGRGNRTVIATNCRTTTESRLGASITHTVCR